MVLRKYISRQIYTYALYIHKLNILKLTNSQTLKTVTFSKTTFLTPLHGMGSLENFDTSEMVLYLRRV